MKTQNITLLSIATLLSLSLWFSASAVVPQLTTEWNLSSGLQAWVTMSVQIGFVFGALISAVFNLADKYPAAKLVAVSALLGAIVNALIPLYSTGPTSAIIFRFLTGVAMAGVYPPAMKIMASWCREDRGKYIGLLVGAVVVGSGMPHLLNALSSAPSGIPAWQFVLYGTSAQAGLAAIISWFWITSGPHLGKASRFNWRHATQGITDQATRLANFGYFGHMWELYAMWAWAPIMLLVSYQNAGFSESSARYAAFGIFGAGGIGSLIAGIWADKIGRTTITSIALVISAICCALVGFFFEQPLILTAICIIWGFAVVADSAQFSAAVSELADPSYVGTALQVQTSIGFLLTLVTLQAMPSLIESVGHEYAYLFLIPGPIFGILSMLKLRKLPDSLKMAFGNR